MAPGEVRSQNADTRSQKWGRCLLLAALLGTGLAHGLTPGWARARAAEMQMRPRRLDVPTARPDTDLVVGYPDSNETRVISGTYAHQGRIIVLNNGTLILDSADFTLRGDIFVVNHGTMRVRKGRLTVPQQFAYQYGAQVSNDGRLELDTCQARYGGSSWGVGVTDSAAFTVNACTLRFGFTTVSLLGHAQVNYTGSDFGSEYVIFDSSRLHIRRCDTALVWLGFASGSSVDVTLPGADTTLRHWEIHDGMPGVSGIGYAVTLDTMAGVLWGSFPQSGCSVTIRDSRMRTTGLLIPGPDSVYMSGLVNNQQHADYTLPLADRQFRLVNTYLGTWNLYPVDSVRFVLESSVFGEMLAMGALKAVIQNSICDGTGGYVGAEGPSQLFFVLSMIQTQIVSRDRSLVVGAASTVRFGSVNATDASTMLLMFCTSEFDPRPLDTSVVYLCDYTVPSGAAVETVFPITGTADIQPGPENPLRFGSYRFSYASADSQTIWHPIGVAHTTPVHSDTLETWDTHGLAPGPYVLKMTLTNSSGDSIEPTKGVNLGYAGVGDSRQLTANSLRLTAGPNPGRGRVRLSYVLPEPGDVELAVYDLQGRLVRALADGARPAGRYRAVWDRLDGDGMRAAAGIYIVRLATPDAQLTRKLVLTQ
jgi:hypothetical protein